MADETKATEVAGSEASTDKIAGSTEKTTSDAKEGWVPQDRLKEVVDQRNEFKGRLETLETELQERQKELGQMVDLLQARETDSQLLTSIRALATDGNETHRSLVENLDKVLRGVEEAVKEGEIKPEDAAIETKRLIAETSKAVETAAADQQADLLLLKANLLAEKYFDALPTEYSEKDKEVLASLLTDAVNWEAIEENPNVLEDAIPQAFEDVLKFFGEPRGTPAKEEAVVKPVVEQATPEVPKHLQTNWGELKEVQVGKGLFKQPVHSDEDFRAALAEELKRINKGG